MFCAPHDGYGVRPDRAVCANAYSRGGALVRDCVTRLAVGSFQPAGSQMCGHGGDFLSCHQSDRGDLPAPRHVARWDMRLPGTAGFGLRRHELIMGLRLSFSQSAVVHCVGLILFDMTILDGTVRVVFTVVRWKVVSPLNAIYS